MKIVLAVLSIFAVLFSAKTGWAFNGTVSSTSAVGSSQISVTVTNTDNSETIVITVTNAPTGASPTPTGASPTPTSASPTPTSSPAPTATCPPGQVLCADGCKNLNVDVNNCGNCGSVCAVANGVPGCVNGN